MTDAKIFMKAIVMTDEAERTAGTKQVEWLEPQAAINDIVGQVHESAFISDELSCHGS
jgi:hypothetical protein